MCSALVCYREASQVSLDASQHCALHPTCLQLSGVESRMAIIDARGAVHEQLPRALANTAYTHHHLVESACPYTCTAVLA